MKFPIQKVNYNLQLLTPFQLFVEIFFREWYWSKRKSRQYVFFKGNWPHFFHLGEDIHCHLIASGVKIDFQHSDYTILYDVISLGLCSIWNETELLNLNLPQYNEGNPLFAFDNLELPNRVKNLVSLPLCEKGKRITELS